MPESPPIRLAGLWTSTDLPILLDARRYFKQSEIILYRQAPELANGGGAEGTALPAPPPENASKVAAAHA
jgi:hypothetical protein